MTNINLKNFRWLELAVIAVLAMIGIGVYLLFFRAATYTNVRVKLSNQPLWYVANFKPGLVENDALGRPHVEITDVNWYPSLTPNQYELLVDLKVKTVFSQSTNTYMFNSRPVLVGNTIRTQPGPLLLEAPIVAMNDQLQPRRLVDKVVTVRIFGSDPAFPNVTGVYPYVTQSIDVGDTVTDGKGNIWLEVLEKTTVPDERIVTTNNGQVIKAQDPIKQQVTLKLKAKVFEFNGQYFIFDDTLLANDNSIPLSFGSVRINGTVINIEDPQ